VTCNSGLRPPSALSARSDFICLVHHTPNDCTVLHVTPTASAIVVRLLRRHGACAEPL
jgi:hypothetical protein